MVNADEETLLGPLNCTTSDDSCPREEIVAPRTAPGSDPFTWASTLTTTCSRVCGSRSELVRVHSGIRTVVQPSVDEVTVYVDSKGRNSVCPGTWVTPAMQEA